MQVFGLGCKSGPWQCDNVKKLKKRFQFSTRDWSGVLEYHATEHYVQPALPEDTSGGIGRSMDMILETADELEETRPATYVCFFVRPVVRRLAAPVCFCSPSCTKACSVCIFSSPYWDKTCNIRMLCAPARLCTIWQGEEHACSLLRSLDRGCVLRMSDLQEVPRSAVAQRKQQTTSVLFHFPVFAPHDSALCMSC